MDLRYPVGTFSFEGTLSDRERQAMIDQIAETPQKMRNAVDGLNEEQLNTPYRPDGWTVRQVVHHVPDSHLNSYLRFKLALTQEHPTIIAYDENIWANLDDARSAPVDVSLDLLESLHKRWVLFLRSLRGDDFGRTFNHPEIGTVSVDKNLALYAWHGRHHVAHITSLRERSGW
ncbi:MAG TPA: putative metal-dependent hydrolase [Pyrinomonadaceae bacterium]|nr:putative metal-dependent hydrolase [Pyrinomonadaceae bacterium]